VTSATDSTNATGDGDEDGDEDAETATDTGAESPAGEDDPLAEARDILADATRVTLAVLGDSTSNSRSEWVHLWAEHLAQGRPVTIWSGSQTGSDPTYPLGAPETMVPEEPDLVIYIYGHNLEQDEVEPAFTGGRRPGAAAGRGGLGRGGRARDDRRGEGLPRAG
jgi:hypothetical protein